MQIKIKSRFLHFGLFWDRVDKSPHFSFDITNQMEIIFINLVWKKNKLRISDYTKEKTKECELKVPLPCFKTGSCLKGNFFKLELVRMDNVNNVWSVINV